MLHQPLAHLLALGLALLPVALFLLALVMLDSYKLVRFRVVLALVGLGAGVALACYFLNPALARLVGLQFRDYSAYLAPLVEELLKALPIALALSQRRIGFLVDAAIWGFAIGTGFATLENIQYLLALGESDPALWAIRGFGTAVMHGGATGIFGVLARLFTERRAMVGPHHFLPGLAAAAALHSLYNQFFVSPGASTLVVLIVVPILFGVTYWASENATEEWLGAGFDSDQDLLAMINLGRVAETRVGEYLTALTKRFEPQIVADMLCLIRLRVELAIKAKGRMLMRKEGFALPPDPQVEAAFAEIEYLETAIGRTGMMALRPIFHTSGRDLWQLHMLRGERVAASGTGGEG